jgi:signal transduction histidine kinase
MSLMSRTGSRAALCLLASVVCGEMLLAQGTSGRVQLGLLVRSDTVTVGEHFTVVVRVRAAQGSEIIFPTKPDSAAAVDTAAASVRHDTTTASFTEATTTYTLAPWDTGAHRLQLGDVIVRAPNGTQERVSLSQAAIYVRSVLPADTALRVPKPARPAIIVEPFNWRPWLWLAAALGALGILYAIWRWWRRRRDIPVDPVTWAEREFRRVEALKLLDTANPSAHAVAMTAVLREYLSRHFGAARRSATTRELSRALRHEQAVPLERVVTLLQRIDLLKFARDSMGRDEAGNAGVEARALVRAVEKEFRAAAARAEQQQAPAGRAA